jgi:hypothetical protein
MFKHPALTWQSNDAVLEGRRHAGLGFDSVIGGTIAGVALAALDMTSASAGLRVETRTPAALCPDIAEVRRAVSERLSIEGDGEWLASYDLVHRPESETEDVVRVELRDPKGRLRLRRELPRSGASCVALAQAVAVVLETYFRHPGEPISEGGAPAATVQGARGIPMEHAGAPAAAARSGRFAAGLLAAWTVGPSSPAVAVGLSYGGRDPWEVGFDAVWMTSEQTRAIDLQPGQGTGFLRSSLFHAWGALRLGGGRPIELLIGPELALGIDWMRTMNVPEGRENARASFGIGARGQLRVRVASHVALAFVAAADYAPGAWAGRFEIAGVSTEPFPSPRARVLLGVGLDLMTSP